MFAAWCVCMAAAIVLFSVFSIRLYSTEGERIFFVGSASSQGLQCTALRLSEIGSVGGESVYFETDGERTPREVAEEIVKTYRAEIVRTEYVCGVYSYYAYTPLWAESISIEGQRVNLHIAIEEDGRRGAVGTPIVFGGY